MENVIVFDESKTQDNTLYCFAGILYKNNEIKSAVETELNNIFVGHNNNNPGCKLKELKGSDIGDKISEPKKTLLKNLFDTLKKEICKGNVNIRYFIMYGTDFYYSKHSNV